MDIKFLVIIILIIIGLCLFGLKLLFHILEMKKVSSILDYYQKKIDKNLSDKESGK